MGLSEEVDLVEQPVGGNGVEDVGVVELEVAQVGGGGGAGAAELAGDLLEGESLAAEMVRFEDALASAGSRRRRGGCGVGHGWALWFMKYLCSNSGRLGRGCHAVGVVWDAGGVPLGAGRVERAPH